MSHDPTNVAPFEGGTVAFEVRGTGERSVLFVHGASADRTHWFHQLAASATLDRRLVAVDLPGHGASDLPAAPYRMGLLAHSLVAVLDALALERAVLVGHSNGVAVVREFLRRFPARTEALVAVDGAFEPGLRPEVIAWMRSALERDDHVELMRALFASSPKGELAPEDLARIEAAFLSPRETLLGWLEALEEQAIWRPDPIDVPLLVVSSAGSPHAGEERLTYVRSLAAHAQLHVWEGTGHFPMMERAAAFNACLADFLRALDS